MNVTSQKRKDTLRMDNALRRISDILPLETFQKFKNALQSLDLSEYRDLVCECLANDIQMMSCSPGEPVGSQVAAALGQINTQSSLNAFYADANVTSQSSLHSTLSSLSSFVKDEHATYTVMHLNRTFSDAERYNICSKLIFANIGTLLEEYKTIKYDCVSELPPTTTITLTFSLKMLYKHRVGLDELRDIIITLYDLVTEAKVCRPNTIKVEMTNCQSPFASQDISGYNMYYSIVCDHLKNLKALHVRGFQEIKNAVITKDNTITVYGDAFDKIVLHPLSDNTKIRTNDIFAFKRWFGLASAKALLVDLYLDVLGKSQSMRKIAMLIVNAVSSSGTFVPMTSSGVEKTTESVLDTISNENVISVLSKHPYSVGRTQTNSEKIVVNAPLDIGTKLSGIVPMNYVYVICEKSSISVSPDRREIKIPKNTQYKLYYTLHKPKMLKNVIFGPKIKKSESTKLKLDKADGTSAFIVVKPIRLTLKIKKPISMSQKVLYTDTFIYIPSEFLTAPHVPSQRSIDPRDIWPIETTISYSCTNMGFFIMKLDYKNSDDGHDYFSINDYVLCGNGSLTINIHNHSYTNHTFEMKHCNIIIIPMCSYTSEMSIDFV